MQHLAACPHRSSTIYVLLMSLPNLHLQVKLAVIPISEDAGTGSLHLSAVGYKQAIRSQECCFGKALPLHPLGKTLGPGS